MKRKTNKPKAAKTKKPDRKKKPTAFRRTPYLGNYLGKIDGEWWMLDPHLRALCSAPPDLVKASEDVLDTYKDTGPFFG